MQVRVVAVAVAVAMGVAACGNASSVGGSGTGQTAGVSSTEIRVGGLASVTGPLGDQYAPIFDGAQAYFDMVNGHGGVFGRKIKLVARLDDEDGYPQRASGRILCGSSLDLGQLRLDCAFFGWSLDGRPAVGRYDILRRAA